MSSMPTLVLLALIAGPLAHHFATSPGRIPGAPGLDLLRFPRTALSSARSMTQLSLASRHDEFGRPPARPLRAPFTSRDRLSKHRAVTGINAHVRWYERVGSFVGIVILVAIMGVLLAASVGLLFIAARILLEVLIG